MAEVGPDGNMWIIDWYNYIVQHNPTPQGFTTGKGNAYESDLRDKTHGRIYRLVYDAGEANAIQPPAQLDPGQPASLVAGLQHSNRLWRRHAQRLLVERGRRDVVPSLLKLLDSPNVDSTGNNAGAIHALWTLHGLGVIAEDSQALSAVIGALKHPAPGARRNAALVLPPSQTAATALLESGCTADVDAQVQLAAVLALADMPPQATVGAHLAALTSQANFMADRNLAEAAICAASTHAEYFLLALLKDSQPLLAETASAMQVIAEHRASWYGRC